jgi:hypothetical protein
VSVRRSAASLAIAFVVAGLLIASPGPVGEPLRRLVNVEADGPDPHYDRPISARSIRRAAATIPDDATYAIEVPRNDPVLVGNLKAAGQLFFTPALPLQEARRADWIVRYRAGVARARSNR